MCKDDRVEGDFLSVAGVAVSGSFIVVLFEQELVDAEVPGTRGKGVGDGDVKHVGRLGAKVVEDRDVARVEHTLIRREVAPVEVADGVREREIGIDAAMYVGEGRRNADDAAEIIMTSRYKVVAGGEGVAHDRGLGAQGELKLAMER